MQSDIKFTVSILSKAAALILFLLNLVFAIALFWEPHLGLYGLIGSSFSAVMFGIFGSAHEFREKRKATERSPISDWGWIVSLGLLAAALLAAHATYREAILAQESEGRIANVIRAQFMGADLVLTHFVREDAAFIDDYALLMQEKRLPVRDAGDIVSSCQAGFPDFGDARFKSFSAALPHEFLVILADDDQVTDIKELWNKVPQDDQIDLYPNGSTLMAWDVGWFMRGLANLDDVAFTIASIGHAPIPPEQCVRGTAFCRDCLTIRDRDGMKFTFRFSTGVFVDWVKPPAPLVDGQMTGKTVLVYFRQDDDVRFGNLEYGSFVLKFLQMDEIRRRYCGGRTRQQFDNEGARINFTNVEGRALYGFSLSDSRRGDVC